MKTIDIHGSPYVMVKDRVIKFHEDYPNGAIETELTELPDRYKCKCIVTPDVENPKRIFTGHAVEIIASSKINELSAAECSETSAIGRGMAALGIGVEHEYASGDEVANAIFQQNEEDATGVSYTSKLIATQDTPKTAENGLKCPKCGKGVLDQRVEDIDGSMVCPKSQSGKKLPSFKCVDNDDYKNPTCKFASWKLTEDEAGVMVIKKATHQEEYTPEQLSELDSIENEQKTNEELFSEI
tara:strand:+ start:741 stop:1463 length:723 start_codon:yes stop_codon:yes gene_type:complete